MARKGRKFKTHTATNGLPYWTLVAGNGEVLATSQPYKGGEQAMMKTLNGLVGKRFPTKIEEETK